MAFRIDKKKCLEVLEQLYKKAEEIQAPVALPEDIGEQLEVLIRSSVGAPLRVLLALLMAKIINPQVNILYPSTNAKEVPEAFSGRTVDEHCIQALIDIFKLPLMQTTGFLTPTFRTPALPIPENLGDVIQKNVTIYNAFSNIIHRIQNGDLKAEDVLIETLRRLINLKKEREAEIKGKLNQLSKEDLDFSAEDIVSIISQLLSIPKHKTSRIPVLVIAALHKTLEECLQERLKPLENHTAADSKTGALGDIELVVDDGYVVRVYEIKDKVITETDINKALKKILKLNNDKRAKLRQYLFVTTKSIEDSILSKAHEIYKDLGVEMTILDCLGFTRHFLHLFFPFRLMFINNLTEFVMREPDSSVSHALKEYYISLLNIYKHKDH
ncbi:restriction endonuclease, SacI family [Desulfurobacterium crinifex]